jgi:rhodanese-related sulfurtransferase
MTIISNDEVQQRLAAGEKLNLMDVREPHENAEFNIGGVLFPLGKVQTMQVDEIEHLKDEEVICYCRSGNRSGQAALILETLGFTNVKNLAGGMLAWQEKFNKQ